MLEPISQHVGQRRFNISNTAKRENALPFRSFALTSYLQSFSTLQRSYYIVVRYNTREQILSIQDTFTIKKAEAAVVCLWTQDGPMRASSNSNLPAEADAQIERPPSAGKRPFWRLQKRLTWPLLL